jgi:hypothetical protein
MAPRNRVRLFFLDGVVLRRFWWFEADGNDIYWGPSDRAKAIDPIDFHGNSVTIRVPDELATLEHVYRKLSYHESGQLRLGEPHKEGASRSKLLFQWLHKSAIIKPYRICTVISKPIKLYSEYTRKLTRKNASAMKFKIDDHHVQCRHYFEFFISPEGVFSVPEPLLSTVNAITDKPACHSLTPRLILAVRHLVFPPGHELNDWNPDVEVFFVCEDSQAIDSKTKS